MKAIVIDPGTEPVVKTVPETLQALGAMCGGALTLLRFPLDAAGLLTSGDFAAHAHVKPL